MGRDPGWVEGVYVVEYEPLRGVKVLSLASVLERNVKVMLEGKSNGLMVVGVAVGVEAAMELTRRVRGRLRERGGKEERKEDGRTEG